jgi:hypothetical protein
MSRRSSERLVRRVTALAGAFTGALVVSSLALAGFSSGASAAHTVQTKRIFSGARTAAAHTLTDVSSGSSSVKDDNLAYADALIDTTGNWASSFSSTRWLKFSFNNPLPAGVSVSGVSFDFRMIPNAGGDTACYYFEVRRISDDSLLGTHYSSGSPQCVTGSTYSTNSVSLSEVTSSDVANDMYVKLFGRESGAKPMKIDLATVTLSLYGQSITQYPKAFSDAADGSAANGVFLGLDVAGDGVTYTNTTNWPTAYATTKYLQLGFPVILPSGSTISSVKFNRTWHSGGSQNVCYYIDVFSGATLIGTHGSGSQISCSNSTSVWNNDSTTLSEVTSATDANQLYIRIYEKASAGQKSVDDLDSITVTYYLD